jgi:hypothetical protein
MAVILLSVQSTARNDPAPALRRSQTIQAHALGWAQDTLHLRLCSGFAANASAA